MIFFSHLIMMFILIGLVEIFMVIMLGEDVFSCVKIEENTQF
jgi:hypothetical protein